MIRVLLLLCFCFIYTQSSYAIEADTTLLKEHVYKLVSADTPRNNEHPVTLDSIAAYIRRTFSKSDGIIQEQIFEVKGNSYKNIICSFNTQYSKRIVIGAHYDVCGEQPGADDNASGVAGLLELSRLLKGNALPYRVDLVAYALEEPPYFRTEHMGSFHHAKMLHDSNVVVNGMISLEMIGYYSEAKKSQHYPLGLLSLFYGNKGNFITIVNKLHKGKFGRSIKHGMKNKCRFRAKSFTAPTWIRGIDFSDHLNYWKYHYPALMITDTAFFRNTYYHQPGDRYELLDYTKMAGVVNAVYQTLYSL